MAAPAPRALSSSNASKQLTVTFANTTHLPYTYFICRAAAPRYLEVVVGPSSGSTLAALQRDSLSWTINISNPQDGIKPMRLELRVEIQELGSSQMRQVSIPVTGLDS